MGQLVNALLQLTISGLVYIIGQILVPVGLTPELINTYFPSLTLFTNTFKILSIFILIIIVFWSLYKTIFGEISYSEKDNVITLFIRSAFAVVMIFLSMSVMSFIFNIFSSPFYLLNDDTESIKAFDVVNDEGNIFKESITEAFDRFIETAENTSESTYNTAIDKITDWIFPGISILKSLIELICIGVLGYKFIIYILEILQRYFILMLQAYTSTLIWPTFVSKSTLGIFKRWLEIFLSNFILIYLNMWLLGIIVKSMTLIFNPNNELIVSGNWEPNLILGVCSIYVMIKIAQSLDNYIGRILTTATAGSSLGHEIFMNLSMLKNTAGNILHSGRSIRNHFGNESNQKYETLNQNETNETYPGNNQLPNESKEETKNNLDNSSKENNDSNQESTVFTDMNTDSKTELSNPINNNRLEDQKEGDSDTEIIQNSQGDPINPESKNQLGDYYFENGIDYIPTGNDISHLAGSQRLSSNSWYYLESEDNNATAYNHILDYRNIPQAYSVSEFLNQNGIDRNSFNQSLNNSNFTPALIKRDSNGSLSVIGTDVKNKDLRQIGSIYPIVNDQYLSSAYDSYPRLIDSNENQYIVFPRDNQLSKEQIQSIKDSSFISERLSQSSNRLNDLNSEGLSNTKTTLLVTGSDREARKQRVPVFNKLNDKALLESKEGISIELEKTDKVPIEINNNSKVITYPRLESNGTEGTNE